MANLLKVTTQKSHALHDIAATRALEQQAQAALQPGDLMHRAGLSTARLAMALAPHARTIWIACGPGNNGGDGFEAALALHQLGKVVCLSWTGHDLPNAQQPADARQARLRAEAAGLRSSNAAPAEFDLAVDALLGIGGTLRSDRPGHQQMAHWLHLMHAQGVPVLAVDLPTGLDADTGVSTWADLALSNAKGESQLRHTLSLLTLKPGLFTAGGRDLAGQVWFDNLGVTSQPEFQPCAHLQGQDEFPASRERGVHASHKGSYGEVAVLGGETETGDSGPTASGRGRRSMAGAALLAARAALHMGAGRVYVALLGSNSPLNDPMQPELMFRAPEALDMRQQVLVCGCGGGQAVAHYLPEVLRLATRLVLDADALNAIAQDNALQSVLAARSADSRSETVLTPHPLEAARLLQCSVAEVQADRRGAGEALAQRFACVVVLKGSGSVIAAPGKTTRINHSGNAWLATAGTGDVLAGMLGAALASGDDAWAAASRACFQHGKVADEWAAQADAQGESLTASRLAERLRP